MEKIFGRWSDYEDMRDSWFESDYDCNTQRWAKKTPPETFPTENELLFASYGGGSYEGDAIMIWRRDGNLYEAHGSHCSCYGLENQFDAEETTVAALAMRTDFCSYLSDHGEGSYKGYIALLNQLRHGEG